MSKSLKVVFFGTPEFATHILKTINESHHEIVGVVTAPDKPAGRGRQLQESDVKKYVVAQGLTLLQPKNLKAEEFIKDLSALKADVQVVVAFRMLPESVWSMPTMGTFNLHASLLPQYRGAAPINWAIIHQEKVTGVSTFFIDDKIDTGAIIDQEACAIEPRETVGSLYIKLMHLGADLSLKTLDRLAEGPISTTPQKEAKELKEAPKLNASNTFIDLNCSASEVDALVRGLNPYPVAKASLIDHEEVIIKVYETAIVEKNHKMPAGSIVIDAGVLMVACKEHFVELKELQFPNKKRMSSRDLLNGYSFSPEARFGVASR